jgi:hypothetical protein
MFSSILPTRETFDSEVGTSAQSQKATSFRLGMAGFLREQSLRQTRLAQSIGELIGVRGVFKRKSANMAHIRVSRIDLLKLAPNPPGLV